LKGNKILAVLVLLSGIGSMVAGGSFIAMGLIKNHYIVNAMRMEKVTLGDIHAPGTADTIIDSASTAQAAGDTIRGHRRNIAPTYKDLMAGGKYDPTNPKHLTYAQAMNMENYLYLAVAAFGLIQMALAAGAALIIIGGGLFLTGILQWRMNEPALP